MITAQAVEVRVGARVLIEAATFRIGPGDRVGLAVFAGTFTLEAGVKKLTSEPAARLATMR